ncbi:MAG TPA: Hsp20/alpha crystallin family protein [Gemmataceae bacterium]|nr:Hsp20/alpha crystallin family protein [Gemmataceae bacterium]
MSEPTKPSSDEALKGLLANLHNVVNSVQQLAESGVHRVRKGVFPEGTGLHGIYSLTVKADLGRPALTIEIGNPVRSSATEVGDAPATEVVEEAEQIRIVAEMPGISSEDVKINLAGETIKITAQKGSRKYAKEVALPFTPVPEKVSHTCHDGILEIKILK